jgi:hypothetical protein
MKKTVVSLLAMAALFACSHAPQAPPDPVTVAFVGDQGIKDNSRKLLELIKLEGADAVVHQGDFDYKHDPEGWDGMITDILGSDFPYFGSAGNHDVKAWDGYQKVLEDRLKRIDLPWEGRLGIKSKVNWRGLSIVLVAPDVFEEDHDVFVREAFAEEPAIWRITSWHKNQRPLQVGGKSSETGWPVYEAAREAGAIMATGHEHSYSRSWVMSNMENQTIVSRSDTMVIDEGQTFVFVNGIAGQSMRRIRRLPLEEWWAKVYTTDNGSNYGALFGVFGVGGRKDMAEFYFKDIDGKVVDRFTVISNVGRK